MDLSVKFGKENREVSPSHRWMGVPQQSFQGMGNFLHHQKLLLLQQKADVYFFIYVQVILLFWDQLTLSQNLISFGIFSSHQHQIGDIVSYDSHAFDG